MTMRSIPNQPTAVPQRRLSRRALFRLGACGAALSAISAILTACSGGKTATDTPKPATPSPATPSSAQGTTTPSASNPASSGGASISVSPTSGSGNASGPSGGQVNVLWRKPQTLHPLFSTSGNEQQVERLMFGALLKVTDKLDTIPDLAEKIDASPDAKTFTFTLRKGLTFNDGQPLTAADVVFTIQRAVDKRTGSVWRSRLLAIAGAADYGDQKTDTISGLETPDNSTIKMTLTDPNALFLATLGSYSGLGILPAHTLKDLAPDQMVKAPFALRPTVTGGAFQFATFAADQYVELHRNETYAGSKAKLDKLFLKILDPQVGLVQLLNGELDVMTLGVSDIDTVKKNANLDVVSVGSPSINRFVPNYTRPYLKDKRVRQAMLYAIDRESIVKDIYKGQARIVNSPIIGPDWMGQPEFNTYTFNPDKARQLLKDAGWDTTRKVQLMLTAPGPEMSAYLPIIQQEYKDVGLQMELFQVESTELNQRYIIDGNYDLFHNAGDLFGMDPGIAGSYLGSDSFAPGGSNGARYSNPQLDDLFKQGKVTTDRAKRKTIYTDAARLINDELPEIYFWSPTSIFGVNKRLVGFKGPGYADNKLWNAEEWSVTK